MGICVGYQRHGEIIEGNGEIRIVPQARRDCTFVTEA
jgi:hypothetical protein